MNTFLQSFYESELSYYQLKTSMIVKLSTHAGFYEMYQSVLPAHKNSQNAFAYVNSHFKLLFGFYKYSSYQLFIKANRLGQEPVMYDANYLRAWFVDKGFGNWLSFFPLVLHYYPETDKNRLLDFWVGKHYNEEIVKVLNYVKQIIG